ncbi:cupin domain-containing protein [Bdellovibrio reynosensis]|uniref:Cupin domain-containing protein n=1 Tax=Bdellovibrio reynosensis TaxID=2835041 RepID=A0ABY4CAE3_9BACT|nr:cupin domain-containing protein [Bdellovibrio reynosensis]UOF00661.1 cupin domain-containing protein [Bdellovibrio reynosensis]
METNKRHKNVASLSEMKPFESTNGRFSVTAKNLSIPAGAKELGCNWFELPVGKTSFPYHFHTGIEEAIYILKGQGTARIGKDQVEVKEGDFLSFPAGPENAHTLINSGTEPMQYLCFSNHSHVDIMGYPDSKKIGFYATPDPAEWPQKSAWVRMMIKDQPNIDYFEGENKD